MKRITCVLSLGVLVCGLLGWFVIRGARAGEATKSSPAKGGQAADRSKADAGPDAGTEVADPFKVPEGSAAELLDFIEKAMRERPKVRQARELPEFYKKRSNAILSAAEKILAAKPTDEQAEKAVQAKLGALIMLSRVGEEGALGKLDALVGELKNAGRTALARQADAVVLGVKLGRIGDAKSEEFTKLVDEVRKHIAAGPVEVSDVSLLMTVPRVAESLGNLELAGRLYSEFAKVMAASENKQIAGVAKRMEGAARRMALPGNMMRIEGTMLDGARFDWSKYRGKVVFVDFWATWCGPCRAEMPNVKKAHEAYHARGFDVVGLSLDRDLGALEQYVKDEEVPWAILLDQPAILKAQAAKDKPEKAAKPEAPEKSEDAGRHEFMADYYGVLAIPTTLLVDKDGKVVSLSARGSGLQKHLEKLLGPVEEPKEPSKPSKTPSGTSG